MSRSQRSRTQSSRSSNTRLAQTQPAPAVPFESNSNSNQFLDVEQKQELIKKIVIYILQNATIKIPIKRVDITKNILNGQSNLFNELFGHARVKLRSIYGIKICDAGKSNYMCIKEFPTDSLSFVGDEGKKRFSLLFMIISYIYMKGGKIALLTLKEYLKSFDVHIETDHHVFGNVKKLIEDFTKQLYLKKTVTRNETKNEEVVEYAWGERSELEFDKKVLLEKVASLLKKPVECFIEQYSKAYDTQDESMDVSQDIDSDE